MGQHPSAILCQDPEELELDRREMDLAALATYDTCRKVDFEAVEFEAWFLASGVGPSEICKQACHQFARPKRLRHVVVRAGLERAHLLRLIAHRR